MARQATGPDQTADAGRQRSLSQVRAVGRGIEAASESHYVRSLNLTVTEHGRDSRRLPWAN